MNEILGGNFSSRLNMNLREDKGWSYGAFSGILPGKAQGLMLFLAPVQIDKTAEAMTQVKKEISNLRGLKPATEDELALMRKNKVLALPGKFESGGALLSYMMDNAVQGRAHEYAETLPEKYRSLNAKKILNVARSVLRPNSLTWIVVGDLTKIEQNIRNLNMGEVVIVDADGNVLR